MFLKLSFALHKNHVLATCVLKDGCEQSTCFKQPSIPTQLEKYYNFPYIILICNFTLLLVVNTKE